jgi:hypothetical protein
MDKVISSKWSKLTVMVILSLIAGCGSKDPLEVEQSSLALKTDTLVLSPIGPYWPTMIEGDCEFNGHGPFVRLKARLYVRTDSLMCHVYMYARETEANWSTAEGSWETLLYRATAGWTIDDLLVDPDSCESEYIDDTGAYKFDSCSPFIFQSLGDTGGGDICAQSLDDTHCIVHFDTLLVRLRKF